VVCFDERTEVGRLYTAIVRTMARECAERDVLFRVLILPGEDDLHARASPGGAEWEAWAEKLRGDGVRVVDVAPHLVHSGVELDQLFARGGHYTSRASELVARALVEEVGDAVPVQR
jgi:hypothetical protein